MAEPHGPQRLRSLLHPRRPPRAHAHRLRARRRRDAGAARPERRRQVDAAARARRPPRRRPGGSTSTAARRRRRPRRGRRLSPAISTRSSRSSPSPRTCAFWAALARRRPRRRLAAFGLAALADRPAHLCSAGQRRRLGLARLLLAPRRLWLLDEPTVALDAAATAALLARSAPTPPPAASPSSPPTRRSTSTPPATSCSPRRRAAARPPTPSSPAPGHEPRAVGGLRRDAGRPYDARTTARGEPLMPRRLGLVLPALLLAAPAAAATDCAGVSPTCASPTSTSSPRSPSRPPDGLPEFCSVRGYVRPAINFEFRLPADWNGGFYMAGCGGFCGQLALRRARLHQRHEPRPAPRLRRRRPWTAAIGAPARRRRAGRLRTGSPSPTGPTARCARPRRRQGGDRRLLRHRPGAVDFAGCSTGGRMANMLARQGSRALRRHHQRRAGARLHRPRRDLHGLLVQANTAADGSQIVTPEVVPLIRDTVLGQCDAAGRARGRAVSDPDACTVDCAAALLAWHQRQCLSPSPDRDPRRLVTEGAVNAAGERLYPATSRPAPSRSGRCG